MWRVQMTFKHPAVPGRDVTYIKSTTAREAEEIARNVHKNDFGGIRSLACREVS